MPNQGRARVEAHVMQSGKLLTYHGASAPSQEHVLTSKSRHCPRSIEPTAYTDFWLPGINYFNTVLPQQTTALPSLVACDTRTDDQQRPWLFLARIDQPSEGGEGSQSRSFSRVRTIAVPATTARQMWSIVADCITPHLKAQPDYVEEDTRDRFARDTLWIETSDAARHYAARRLSKDPLDAAENLAVTLIQGFQAQRDRRVELPMGQMTESDVCWAIAMAEQHMPQSTAGNSRVAPTFIIGVDAKAPRNALDQYTYVFVRD